MDKNAIKTFAVESRRKMIESVKYQASLIGITADGIAEPVSKAEGMETYDYGAGQHTIYDDDIKKRESLVREVKNKGFDNVVEEVAYTWFNRIIAIRYMEVNDYLPTRTRVLSSETEGKIEPDIITEALDLDLDYSDEDIERISKFKLENENDKLYQLLFIKQCNKLNMILPGLFEKTDDYMELLLDIKFTDEDSVVRKLVDTISEEDFGEQVEIIGWLYQFYNVELKEKIFAGLKKNIKINKENIPAATQLFTPDWIVKYMVQNSLGKFWLEKYPNDNLKSKWIYFIEDILQDKDVKLKIDELKESSNIINPKDIKVIDPCCGSGHILVYIFDILMQIYVSEGFTEKDAAENILKNNIYGLDVDDRAYQLSYFAVMMKARSYNRRILTMDINPKVISIQESNSLDESIINIISTDEEIKIDLKYILDVFKNAKNLGSILNIKKINFKRLFNILNNFEKDSSNLSYINYQKEFKLIKSLVKQAEYLYNKYDVVVTNPPYMGNTGMNKDLREYLKENYPLSKNDLFSVFLEKGLDMVKDNGFNSMVTMQSWMFLSSFKKLRKELLNKSYISNLLHMENMVMGIAFGTSATVFRKTKLYNFKGAFNHIKLQDIGENGAPKEFPVKGNKNMFTSSNIFNRLPGNSIAYWVSDKTLNAFENGEKITKFIDSFQGIITGNNEKFLRYWYELNINKIAFNFSKMNEINLEKQYWIPYNKGGKFRKWYGNQDYVVYWKNGPEDKTRGKKTFSEYYLKDYVSWSYITSSTLSTRYFPKGFLWDVAGSGMFDKKDYLFYLQALLTSNVGINFLKIINPTLNFQVENILDIPVIFDEGKKDVIDNLVKENIRISKKDWDSFEISWNFKTHPFIHFKGNNSLISNILDDWKYSQLNYINIVQKNEILLNKHLINIYDLNDEISDEISIEDITLYVPIKEQDIKSFISYSVGCMFGRYSLDKEGLQFAGGEFNINNYSKFIPDDDNIIPVLDTEYFNDDIVGRFVEFVKVCFGEETLEENLDFIAGALKKKGKTSREIIRNYFIKDFFKDHAQTYKKCPIYWQFDSGKQNAFKCLIYMHRYEPGLVARVRTDYLHKTQKAIEQNLAHCESIIANSSNKSEVSKATKDKSKYIKQLDEIKVYDEALAHIANQRIEIDLDDGVKVNHAKFQNVEISKEGQKAKKINLLKKI